MANYRFTRAKNYAAIAGRRLQRARTAAKLRQPDIAEPAGLSPQAISYYESGKREMAVEVAIKLGKLVNEHPAYLIGLIDELDRDILKLPLETRMHIAAAFAKHCNGK